MKKYWHVWWKRVLISVQIVLANRTGMTLFTLGKLMRFSLFIVFLLVLNGRVKQIAGYNFNQMFIFFLVFNLIDLFGQLFFRGIYWFRNQVVSGEFDMTLIKPISAIFQVLTQNTDVLDLPLIFISLGLLIFQVQALPHISWINVVLATISGMIVVSAIHIFVAGMGVITTEVDHTVMIYRDLSQMARVPIDIYTDSIRALLTFVIPVALAFTFPAKAILGLLSLQTFILGFFASLVIFWLSVRFWQYALTQYSSASS